MRRISIATIDRSWLWLLLFGVCAAVTSELLVVPAVWLVAVFGLRFARTYHRGWRGFWLLALAGWLASLVAALGTSPFHAFPPLEALFFAPMAALFALPFAIDRWVVRRVADERPTPLWTTLVFPLVFTAYDFLSSGSGPLGSFGAAGYAQFSVRPLTQLAAVTGLWGIGFLVAWFASTANYIWERGFDWRASRRGIVVYASVLVAAFSFGAVRLAISSTGEDEIHVVGLTSIAEIPDASEASFEADAAAIHDEYLERTRAAAAGGAQVVVWPESGVMGRPEQAAAVLARAQVLAAETGIYLAVTTAPDAGDGEDSDTTMYIIDPTGEIALTHVKYGGTDFAAMLGMAETKSRHLQALDTPYGRISGVVCWDADFPDTMRQIGKLDVDLLLISANDWRGVRNVHAEMAVFRAIENGVSVFRQTSNGVSLATDAYGRVLSRSDSYNGVLVQDVLVPLNSTTTLYTTIGDVFGWLAVAGAAGVVAATWVRERAAKRAGKARAIGPPVPH